MAAPWWVLHAGGAEIVLRAPRPASRFPPKVVPNDRERGVGSVTPRSEQRRSSSRSGRERARRDGQLPVVGRIFPAPVAAKVPEIIFLFWVVKILTTAGGEATSDYLKTWGNIGGGGTEVALFVIGLVLQFGTRRYRAFAYWFLAYAIAIFGTGRLGLPPSRRRHPLRRHDPAVGGRAGGDLLGLAPQRGNAVHPQHHHPATRGLLLGDRVRHLRPRHRARRLHGDLARASATWPRASSSASSS